MAVLTQKLKAFSLVEVLVAMVIIMLVFGLGITITMNVFASNGLERHMQARLALDAYIAHTYQEAAFKDGSLAVQPYRLTRTIAVHPSIKGLVKVEFTINDEQNKTLVEEARWIWLP